MKKVILRTISIALSAVMLFCHAAFAGAVAAPDEDDHGYEKLIAFWHQEAYDGLNNGEAVYDHEWMQNVFYVNGGDPATLHYDDSWYTPLTSTYGDNIILSFNWYLWYCFESELPDGTPISGEGYDYVYPDLYGPLELSETSMWEINSPRADQTHITSINLDACPKLRNVWFNEQRFVTSFSAVGSYLLEKLELKNDALRYIAFSPEAVDKPFEIIAFGTGNVGAVYNKNTAPKKATLYYYTENEHFWGWYRDGELYSYLPELTVTGGGRFVACFGGDADDDGRINAADALFALRAALGLCSLPDVTEADVDCSGAVEATDALAILRLVLGIY